MCASDMANQECSRSSEVCYVCHCISMLYVGDKSSSGAVAVGDEIGIQLLSNVLGMTCETAMEMMCVMESGACDLGSICLSITIY